MSTKKQLSRRARRMLAAALVLTPIGAKGITAVLAEGEYVSYGNPYGGGWSNCTWAAWQLAYNATGIALPAFGYSTGWYSAAAAMGFSVGTEPRANSIGVYYNHVVYVAACDGENIFVQEGGYLGGYNEGWSNGYSSRYGQGIIGYIYLDGYVSDAVYSYSTWDDDSYSSEATVIADTRKAEDVIPKDNSVELAISPNVASTEIENLDEAVLKKYTNDSFTEPVKADEIETAKEIKQEEESTLVKISDTIETTSTVISEVVVTPSKTENTDSE